jgi:ABC-type transporter MlaC component
VFPLARSILIVCLAAAWSTGAEAGIANKGVPSDRPRIALVIGNSAYKTAPLPNSSNDARLISSTLKSLGFDVAEHIDITRRQMKRAVAAFEDRLQKAGKKAVGVFYYAGHGVQVRGKNYLLPVNADVKKEYEVDDEALDASNVLEAMEFAGNELNFVILDACRNNPFPRSFRSATKGLARMDAPSGTLISYSTAPGDVAADGTEENSPYTKALASAMVKPGLAVEQMFKKVRVAVRFATKDEQTPWESSSLTGDFYFVPGSAGTIVPPTASLLPTDTSNTSEEIAYWQSIQASKDPNDFDSYLDRYGSEGAFTVLARNRAKLLRAHKVDGTSPTQQGTTRIKSQQQLAAEALIRGRKMIEELAESANLVMDNDKIPFGRRIEKFRGLLGEVVDFKPMARFVLQDHYDRASPKEWEDFYATYKELFLSGYDFTSGERWSGEYVVEKIRAYGKDTLVTVRLTQNNEDPLHVAFRVRIRPDSFFGYKIIDVLVSDLSLLVTQRADFKPALNSGGIRHLIATLERKFGKAVKPVEIP